MHDCNARSMTTQPLSFIAKAAFLLYCAWGTKGIGRLTWGRLTWGHPSPSRDYYRKWFVHCIYFGILIGSFYFRATCCIVSDFFLIFFFIMPFKNYKHITNSFYILKAILRGAPQRDCTERSRTIGDLYCQRGERWSLCLQSDSRQHSSSSPFRVRGPTPWGTGPPSPHSSSISATRQWFIAASKWWLLFSV